MVSSPSLPSDNPAQPDLLSNLRLRYRAGTSVFTAVAVLALHALILAPVLRGGSSTDHRERFGAPKVIHAVLIDDRSFAGITPPMLSSPVFRSVAVSSAAVATTEQMEGPLLRSLRCRSKRIAPIRTSVCLQNQTATAYFRMAVR